MVRERIIPETNIREIIDDENNVAELHSETYPDDIIGIRRIHDNVKFGCVVCENLGNYVVEDYEEYEIPEETEEETNVPEYN